VAVKTDVLNVEELNVGSTKLVSASHEICALAFIV
jgi:hypothetical protein